MSFTQSKVYLSSWGETILQWSWCMSWVIGQGSWLIQILLLLSWSSCDAGYHSNMRNMSWSDNTWYNDTMLILTPMILIRVNSSDWCWYWTLTLSQLRTVVQLCSLIHNEGLKCFSSWSQPAQEDSRVFIQTTQLVVSNILKIKIQNGNNHQNI